MKWRTACMIGLIGCSGGSKDFTVDMDIPTPLDNGPCLVAFYWTLPTHYEDESLIGATDLTLFSLYVSDHQVLTFDPYVLTVQTPVPRGAFTVTATVSVDDMESDHSNTMEGEC